MGTVFRYIADSALEPASEETYHRTCQYCDATGVDVYDACGYLLPPTEPSRRSARGRAAKVRVKQLPKPSDDEMRHVACAACLLSGRVAHAQECITDEIITRYVAGYLKGQTPNARRGLAIALRDALRRTPRIPRYWQAEDWPLCCGDLTEFTGSPRGGREVSRAVKTATYWERGVSTYYGGRVGLERVKCCLHSLTDISLFRCLACGTVYWTFQFP